MDEKIIELLTKIQNDIIEVKSDVKYVKEKIDNVYEQTYDLTEFKTKVDMKLEEIHDDIDFVKHEEFETKQDLFKLKKNLKVIK